MRFRVRDHMQDVRLHIELGVNAKSQVSLGLVQIGRETGQAGAGFADDVEIVMAG